MFCGRCGRPLGVGVSLCPACDAPGIALGISSGWGGLAARPAWGGAPGYGAPAAAAAPDCSGLWLRLLAYVIDSFVLGVAASVVGGVVGSATAAALATPDAPEGGAVAGPVAGVLVSVVASWLYFSLMESSVRQATIGKRALGLAVTDAAGAPISFGRASGRHFAKLASAIPLGVGFLFPAVTGRKQALHDLVAGTIVVRRRRSGVGGVVAVATGLLLGGVAAFGILAAIAIPNLLRYGLRVKSAEAPAVIAAIASAELVSQQRMGRLVPLELPRGGTPGSRKLAWSVEDLAVAEALGWTAGSSTYFTYRVEVARTEDGREAFSICAESDLDGDGIFAAVVLWQPAAGAAGAPPAPPPPDPPCAHDPDVERSPSFRPGDPIGQPVRLSPRSVF